MVSIKIRMDIQEKVMCCFFLTTTHVFTETYSVRSYLKERKGERDEMQDAHLIIEDFTKEFTDLHHSM